MAPGHQAKLQHWMFLVRYRIFPRLASAVSCILPFHNSQFIIRNSTFTTWALYRTFRYVANELPKNCQINRGLRRFNGSFRHRGHREHREIANSQFLTPPISADGHGSKPAPDNHPERPGPLRNLRTCGKSPAQFPSHSQKAVCTGRFSLYSVLIQRNIPRFLIAEATECFLSSVFQLFFQVRM